MKRLFSRVLALAAMLAVSGLAVRGDAFTDRMEMVHRGMSARSAVTILGRPAQVTQGPGGSICLIYPGPGGVWQVAIAEGRVIAIQEP